MSQICDDIEERELDADDEGCTCNGPDCDQKVLPEDPYYATPCGTFCSTRMREHVKECGVCRGEFSADFECKRGRRAGGRNL